MNKSLPFFFTAAIAVGIMAAHSTRAQTAVQFVAGGYQSSGIWKNVREDADKIMSAVHAGVGGFIIPQKSGNAVWFGQHSEDSAVSPMEFPEAATNCVITHAFIVVVNEENADRATLVSAPVPLRIEAYDFMDAYFGVTASTDIPRNFVDEFLFMTNTVFVNAKETTTITPAPFKLQLVEFAICDATQETTLADVYLGGHAAVSPKAARSWRGAVVECIWIIGETPSPEDLNAVRRYLSARHRLAGVKTDSDSDIIPRLSAMGIKTFSAFSSIIMVR